MMVVDTSAILAVLFDEPESEQFATKIENDPESRMSAVNVYEAMVVAHMRLGAEIARRPPDLIARLGLEIVPFDEVQLLSAAEAYRRYGKGVHPRARLNICDCAAYALARTLGFSKAMISRTRTSYRSCKAMPRDRSALPLLPVSRIRALR